MGDNDYIPLYWEYSGFTFINDNLKKEKMEQEGHDGPEIAHLSLVDCVV